jgi:lambda repressor-like predicted transcriptional regulator
MSVADTIVSIDKYCVEYIRYVLSVTSRRIFLRRASEKDLNDKIITFSIISVVLGDFLYTTYIAGKQFSQADTIPRLVTEFSLWIVLSVVCFVGVNAFRPVKSRSRFTLILVVVLRVLPSAYVISCYIGVVFHAIDVLFNGDEACRAWQSIGVTIAFRCIFSGIYLAIAFMGLSSTLLVGTERAENENRSALRSVGLSLIVVTVMLATDLVVVGSYIYSQADTQAATIIASVRSPGADLQRLSSSTGVREDWLENCLPGRGNCKVDDITGNVFQRRQREVGRCFGLTERTSRL